MAMEREDSAFTGHPFLLDPEALFRLTNVTGDERRQLFDLFVSTADDIEAIRQQDPTDASFYHDRERARRRPLVPVGVGGEPRLIPLSVGDLAWRVTEGVYWDVADAHRELAPSKRAKKRSVEGFMKEFGLSLERYLERLFRRALPGGAGLAPRFLADVRTSGPHPDNDPQIDLLFPYPDAFVVVEVKSARFHYRNSVVAGDLGHIEGPDLDKVFFGPVEQIDGAVAKLIDGAYDDDRLHYAGQAVYPVLVTYGALPTMWPAWPWLLDGVRDRGHLGQANVRPLAALQVSEAEILAALAMRGHSVSDVVRSYVEGDRSDVSFRNYANEVYSNDADIGTLLADDFGVTHDRFRELFGGEVDLSTSAS